MPAEALGPHEQHALIDRRALLRGVEAVSTATVVPSGHEVRITLDKGYGGTTNRHQGVEQDLLHTIVAGEEIFGVMKVGDLSSHRVEHLLTRFSRREGERATVVGIIGESRLMVGRSKLQGQGEADVSTGMSRLHFVVSVRNGELIVQDRRSKYGTKVLTAKPPTRQRFGRRRQEAALEAWTAANYERYTPPSATAKAAAFGQELAASQWGYTRQLEQVHPLGTLHGYPFIGRDAKISDGIYLNYNSAGYPVREAVTVVPKGWGGVYGRYLREVLEQATATHGSEGQKNEAAIIDAVFNVVSRNMTYSQQEVDELILENARRFGNPDHPMDLSLFMVRGFGVCRHQALVVGALLERLIEEKRIGGHVSVDRNVNWSPLGDTSGHAWARYTDSKGRIFIIDVAKGFKGSLAEARRRAGWNYLRPDDDLELLSGSIVVAGTARVH